MYLRLQKGLKRFSKATLLSVVFLFILLGNVAPTFAQAAQYADYINLFSGTSPSPTLSVYTLFKQGTITPDVKFNFQASFNIDTNSSVSPSDQKNISWDHIVDRSDSQYLFVIRICDASDTTETKCLFSKIPYGLKQGSTTSGVSPDNKNLADAIYHYYKTTGSSTDAAQNDKFNVLFPITELAPLSTTPGGGLGASAPISQFIVIGDTTTYRADAWYCAQSYNGETLPTDQPNENIRQFNNLCGGNRPYFKIATSNTFNVPQNAQDAQNQTPGTIAQIDTNPTVDNIPSCGIVHGSVLGCVAQIVYYLIYRPVAWFAGLLGELFDFFLGYSLNDASYRADFAVRGWQIVRDISNVFFIIILVWVGLSTVFKTSTNLKRVVPNLILNALIINFSLFATRVVIDISNVVARVFYHSISVCDGKCQPRDSTGTIPNLKPGIAGYTPLSEKILSGFNPQKIFSPQVLDETSALPDSGTGTQAQKHLNTNSNEYAGYYIIVSLIAAFIVFAIAMMFWKTAFFFLGRVIGLYIAMIFAPFAFLGRGNIPLVSSIKELSWDNWLKDLTSYALLAPIFVFFLYIVYSMIDSGFITVFTTSTGRNFFETVLFIAIPMLIIYFLITQGVKIASAYAGTIGKNIQGFVDKTVGGIGGVVGGGVGLAAGGAALGLRGLSTLANQRAKKAGWTGWAARNAEDNWTARQLNKGFKWSQTSSMDVRNAGVKIGKKEYTAGGTFGKGLGLLGAKPDYKLADNVGLGQKAFIGGNVKIQKERDKKKADNIKNRISYDHLSDAEAREVWQQKIEKDAKKKAEQEWQKNIYKDASLKPVVDELERKEDTVKKAEQNLATATASNDQTTISLATSTLNSAKQDRDRAKEELQNASLKTIEDLKKDKAYQKSEVYTELAKDERDRLKKDFGEIKDAKSLTSAMRAEYARNLRESSFWMKDGKPRWGLSTGGGVIAGDLALSLTSLNAGIDAGIGAIVGGHIKELQNSFERASKSVMDEHKKTVGKGSEIGKWEEKLKHYDDKIKELVKLHKGVENIDVDDIDNATTIEDALIVEMAEKNKEITSLDKKGDKRTKQDEIDLARARAEVNKYRNLQEDRDKLKDKINAGKAKNKESEDKKNKDGDKGDKPKDDKK